VEPGIAEVYKDCLDVWKKRTGMKYVLVVAILLEQILILKDDFSDIGTTRRKQVNHISTILVNDSALSIIYHP
jgi:hypothetical protein